jgi:hypothetical protein
MKQRGNIQTEAEARQETFKQRLSKATNIQTEDEA